MLHCSADEEAKGHTPIKKEAVECSSSGAAWAMPDRPQVSQ